ncbi:MAG: ATP-binding cassette domain-containing protein, partial [Limisphaerales bacterium]
MLTISGISKSFGPRTLFEDVSLQVNREDRIGLVGPNGAGKTTLLSIILKQIEADTGSVNFERGITVGYLPQESAPTGDETVLNLATAISPEMEKLQRLMRAFEAMEAGVVDPALEAIVEGEDYYTVQDRYIELGGYQLEPKAKQI